MRIFSLDGRTALVTGANTGIGRSIARCMAEAGAEVICAGRSSCEGTVAEIEKGGGKARSLHLDLSDSMAGDGYSSRKGRSTSW
ncbi:Fatty acyl-CoA reductase (plasmid) [Nitratireductor thuwali]|uniref:Fatty acyl-CoA reductase n=1 Tax=Nitratireductor thuwali TaxID=2267699 RepID=A0ABY5MSD7_9HYPH|nr:Fatty acyl-CoA reductase [Nitratireductor thuwali]